MNFCPNCGTSLQENTKFCSSCGFNLMENKAENHPENPNVQLFTNKLEGVIGWVMKNKKLVFGVIGAVILIAIINGHFNSDEKRALKTAQEFFEEECADRGCEFDSFYDVETELKQKEDEDLNQPGRYRINAGVKLKSEKSGEYQYYRFGMNVEFLDGSYQRAGYPSIDTDYDKQKEMK